MPPDERVELAGSARRSAAALQGLSSFVRGAIVGLVTVGLLLDVAFAAERQASCPLTVEAGFSSDGGRTWSSAPKGIVAPGDIFRAECSDARLSREVDERLVLVMSNGAEADVVGRERRSVVELVARTLAMLTTPNQMRMVPRPRRDEVRP